MFLGIGALPEPATESHVVNRGPRLRIRGYGDLVEIESLQLSLWTLGLVWFIVTFHDVPFQ
jgi:hypothetical protein